MQEFDRSTLSAITPEGTILYPLDHRLCVSTHPNSNLPTYFKGEYRPGLFKFTKFVHPPLQLEISSSGEISFCTYVLFTLDSPPNVNIIGALMISLHGNELPPSLMLLSIKSNMPNEPEDILFLVPIDTGIYFVQMKQVDSIYNDPVDHFSGSMVTRGGVNLTKQNITGLHIHTISTNTFVADLKPADNLDL